MSNEEMKRAMEFYDNSGFDCTSCLYCNYVCAKACWDRTNDCIKWKYGAGSNHRWSIIYALWNDFSNRC